jgi:hypothetical protein
MANKNDLFDFDETTASNNDNVQGANIAENCAPSGINNAIRGLASIVKRAVGSQGSAVASAGTTAIGAAGTALYTTVTGTTTITSFGTVGAGTLRIIEFTGSLTLTHNATSLKLPGAANIVTAAGDVGFFLSLGSGNWKCLHFSRADGAAVASFSGTLTSNDGGSSNGPVYEAYRNSVSPAASDEIGELSFTGNSSTGLKRQYGGIDSVILDPTNGSEDAVTRLLTITNGVLMAPLTAGQGVQIGSPAGGDRGVGSLNAAGVYIAGHGTLAQVLRDVETTYSTTTSVIPDDNTIPQQSEGTEILAVTITPTNAASKIRIRCSVMATHGTAANPYILSLFQDSVASAFAATMGMGANSGWPQNTMIESVVDAASTTTRTYKLRIGGGTTGTVAINGNTTARLFGGVSASTMEVEEILPQ